MNTCEEHLTMNYYFCHVGDVSDERPDLDDDGNVVDPLSALGIKMKYERINRAIQNQSHGNANTNGESQTQQQLPPLVGVLSKVVVGVLDGSDSDGGTGGS